MPRQSWLLINDSPCIDIQIREPFTGFTQTRTLLADTGAGGRFGPADLILSTSDAAHFGLSQIGVAGASGALDGEFPVFLVDIEMPALRLIRSVRVLSVPAANFFPGTQGFACFRFLNTFNYGNGGNPAEFVLETL